MYNLEYIEKRQNIKFPEAYKQLYKTNFKEFDNRAEIYSKEENIIIRKFLTAMEINECIDEFFDYLGYDLIPIAETIDDDYICLYYRDSVQIPSIVYWVYELAVLSPQEAIFHLFNNMEEFLNKLI